MRVFWNPAEGRPRAPWRLLGTAALVLAFALLPIVLVALPLTYLHRRGLFLPGLGKPVYDPLINVIVGPLLTVAVIGAVALGRRWLDRRGWEAYGVELDRAWWRGLASGFGLGALLMAAVFAVELALGWVRVDGFLVASAALSVPLALGFSLVKDACVAVYEELVTRGYLLRNLSDALGSAWGVALSSSIFSLLHLLNPNASVASTLGLFAAGLLLAAARLRTGRLSTAIGLHFAWNLFEGPVFGFPVSGDLEPGSLVGLTQGGPSLWTGGAFGPEAGLVGLLASLAGIAVLLCYPLGPSRRTRMLKLTYHGHSCWEMTDGSHRILIDPFLTGNRLADVGPKDFDRLDAILVSHGHADHIGDAVEIAGRTKATVVANFEIVGWFGKKGCEGHPLHLGGGHAFPWGHVKLTVAHHGSTGPEGEPLGNPAGFVITMGGKKVYHAGDTALFSDMRLIGEMWGPLDAALLPIGDNFTMSLDDAVKATEFLGAKVAVPMHFDTFDVIRADADEFVRKVEAAGRRARHVPPGASIEI